MKYLCFDIGGTDIKYGIVDEKGNLFEHFAITRPYHKEELQNILLEIANKYEIYKTITIAMHGYSISDNSYKYYCPEEKLNEAGYNTYMANESNADAYSELYCGNLKGVKNGLVIAIGTGIATGLVINSMVIEEENSGYKREDYLPFLEKYNCVFKCSCMEMLEQYGSIYHEQITGEELMAKINDPNVYKIVNNQIETLVKVINGIGKDLKLDKIVINGGITNNSKYCELLMNNKFDLPVEIGKYKGFSAMVGGCISYVHKRH